MEGERNIEPVELENFGLTLRHGIDVVTIFGDRHTRLQDFLEYMFELAFQEFEADPENNILPIVFVERAHAYGIDYYWFLHAIIEWLSLRNPGASKEKIERYFIWYMVSTSNEFSHIPRFFILGLFGEYFGMMGAQMTFSLVDYKVPKGSFYYGKASYFLRALYEYSGRKNQVMMHQFLLDPMRISKSFDIDFTEEFRSTQQVYGIRQIVFGANGVKMNRNEETAFVPYLFDMKKILNIS